MNNKTIKKIVGWLRSFSPDPFKHNRNIPELTEPYFHSGKNHVLDDLLYPTLAWRMARGNYGDKFVNLVLLLTLITCFFLLGAAATLMIQATT
jgi:hypothetical protein